MIDLRRCVERAGDLLVEPSQHIGPQGMRALWTLSIVLAVGGNLIYLLASPDWSWWIGGLLAAPLLWLAIEVLADADYRGRGDPDRDERQHDPHPADPGCPGHGPCALLGRAPARAAA